MENTAEVLPPEAAESTSTALAIVERKNAAVYFKPQGLDPVIEALKKEVSAFKPDISTEAGRKAIASFSYRIARSKTALDNIGKELVDGIKKQSKAIDAERSRAWDIIEQLQHDVRKPLTEWENKEKTRVEAHETAIQNLTHHGQQAITVAELNAALESLEEYRQREWEEFSERAKTVMLLKEANLTQRRDARQKADEDAAELERLRAAEAERKRKEEEQRIADEAAEKARKEAEDKAAEEARAAQEKADRELAEAAAREQAEREARETAEREAKEAQERADQAERDRIAAEEKAEQDRIAAEEAAAAAKVEADRQAKEQADAAVEEERKRVAAAAEAEAEAQRQREADKAHRSKVNDESMSAIIKVAEKFVDLPLAVAPMAREIVEAIARGEIPNITITY